MHDLFSINYPFKKRSFDPVAKEASVEVPQISRHMITPKPPFSQQRYVELDIFRRQIEQSKAGLHHRPYTDNKRSIFFYKTVFFALAAVFFILGITAMAIPAAASCGFFLGSCTFVKGVIVLLCTVLSLAAFTIGFSMQTEREAVLHCVRRAKAHVATIYARKRIRMGHSGPLAPFFKSNRLEATALKQMYREILDKINDRKDETLHLVHRIGTATTLDHMEREALLNQAIEELSEKLHLLAHSFRHASPPDFAG